MSGILSDLCTQYYRLKMKTEKRDDRYKLLFENLMKFDQQLTVSEVDEILASSFKVIEAYDRYQVAFEKYKETEQKILHLLKRLGLRPRWYLTGEIPGELEYCVWYCPKDNVHIMKNRDLDTTTDGLDPNSIYIMFARTEDIQDETDEEREEREEIEAEQRRRIDEHNRNRHLLLQNYRQDDDEETDEDD